MVAGALSFAGLWAILQLVGQTMAEPADRRFNPFLLLFLAMLKLPALYVGWVATSAIGRPGQVGFGSGIVLVYCLAVAGVALRVPPDRPSSK